MHKRKAIQRLGTLYLALLLTVLGTILMPFEVLAAVQVQEATAAGQSTAEVKDSDHGDTTKQERKQRVYIGTVEEFLEFAENCRLDSYSVGLTVVLEENLDLSDVEFEGIPTFGGTFEGNNRSIKGLSMTGNGSVQGLFRYLQKTAVVRNLSVEGKVVPSGSRSIIGGIAGSNGGRIEYCSFSGEIAGAEIIGGLVGQNELTGIIDGCIVNGTISGEHFVGGIAGINTGVIRSTTNLSHINTTEEDNSVHISDITIETLTDSETVSTVTDVGGIAGNSTGVIRDCNNRGNLGYRYIGYNFGGIAGSQTGYVVGCINYGQVYGRKEVGGIVGQMEPTVIVDYAKDTLQILQGQLDTMERLTDKTSADAKQSDASINKQLDTLKIRMEEAEKSLDILLPDKEDPKLPDHDTAVAARNNLSTSLTEMTNTVTGMSTTAKDSVTTLSKDLQAISNQVGAISNTLNEATEHVGGSLTDISDQDTEEDTSSKVEKCVNYGSVLGDLNTGGIVGVISLENDLDPEDDVQIFGELSMNFDATLRAVIRNCQNRNTVTAKKQNAGGIAGWIALGLIRDCENTAAVEAQNADYVGGIVGLGDGFVRNCNANCAVSGASYVGGIAGQASIVTDCRGMTEVQSAERSGAIIGYCQEVLEPNRMEQKTIAGNYYLPLSSDIGGVDGVSYDGLAQPLSEETFFALSNLPDVFRKVTVKFVYEDGSEASVYVPFGSALDPEDIPEVPQKEGYMGSWDGLEDMDTERIPFDITLPAKYIPLETTLGSDLADENGRPLLLIIGEFQENQEIALEKLENVSVYTDSQSAQTDQEVIEAWTFELPRGSKTTEIRYLLPKDQEAEQIKLMLGSAQAGFREVGFTQDGSYLALPMEEGDDVLLLLEAENRDYTTFWLAGGAAAVLLLILIQVIIYSVKRCHKSNEESN